MGERLLGARWDGAGVDFRLTAPAADAVELCLFASADPGREIGRHQLERGPGGTWSGRISGIGPGQLYAYRVRGRNWPAAGLRFDRIPHVVASVMDDHDPSASPTLDDVYAADRWARERARELLGARAGA